MTAGLALWPLLHVRPALAWAGLAAGAVAVLVLAGGLALGYAPAVTAALALVGADYAAALTIEDAALDPRAPLFAGGLLVAAELAYWSLELRTGVVDEPGSAPRRLAVIVLLGLAGMTLGALTLAFVDVARVEGLAVEALGVVAALAAVGLIARLAARGDHAG